MRLGLTDAVIYEDMEYFSGDSSCISAVNAYVSGWSQTLNNSGQFTPGLYESASNVAELSANPMPAYIDIAGGGCTAGGQTLNCTVWNNNVVPNSWWIYDQRLYQYAWNFWDGSNYGTRNYQVDADAGNGMVWGQGGGDGDTVEGSGESLSSDS